jgi:predicted DNA-binding helix-hairpin-helix protein
MDTEAKLALLGGAARYEIAAERQSRGQLAGPRAALCAGDLADGRTGTLLRVLQSSRCEHDCAYCPLRRSNDPQRATLAPDELAGAFAGQWQRGHLDGLLLSSATDGSPDASMSRMLDTIRILRTHHQFDGYVHLKVLPGASAAAIAEAATLADRLSLNVEVPGADYLEGLHTGKRWQDDILAPLGQLRDLDRAGQIRSGITSQLLVGVAAPGEQSAPDRALATGSRELRRAYGLRRMHYGLFRPAPGTPLAEEPPPDARRRARLYQWEWLATEYQFADQELDAAFDLAGNLPLGLDPKLAVSLAAPRERPVEVNAASYEDLLRVPGIGPISARRIVDLRHLGLLRDLQDLRVLGVVTGKAAPFVLLNGRRPPEAAPALQRLRRSLRDLGPRPVQLTLWPDLG